MCPSSFQSIAKLACIDEDITPADEVKVYMDEGEVDNKEQEHLSEDKEDLLDQSDESVDILKPVVNTLLPHPAATKETCASSPDLASLAHGTSTKHKSSENDVGTSSSAGSGGVSKGQYIGNGIKSTLPSLSYISALYNAGVSPFSMLPTGIPTAVDDKGNLISNFNFPNFNLNALGNSKIHENNADGIANPNCTYTPPYLNGLHADFRHWPRLPYRLPTSDAASSFPNHMMQTLGFNPMINGFPPPPPLGSCSSTVPPLVFPHFGTPMYSNNNPSRSFNPYNLSLIDQLRPWDIVAESKASKPHVKKPLNAFMLFMREQREQVVTECTLKESAAINQILGRKWHELDKADQSKYYELARQERLKHMEMYPNWSARDNYGLRKKRKKRRERAPGEYGELARKCRARYGLNQIDLWCKPCRRKKKCSRFSNSDDNASLASDGGDRNNAQSEDGEGQQANGSDDGGYTKRQLDNGEYGFNPMDVNRDCNNRPRSGEVIGPPDVAHASNSGANRNEKATPHF